MLKIIIADKELESLIKTGHSNKYHKYSDKQFLKLLSEIYTILGILDEIHEINNFRFVQLNDISLTEFSIPINIKNGHVSLNLVTKGDTIILTNISSL